MDSREKNTVTYEIKRHIGVIDNRQNGWTRELNLVSWNDGPEKYDIRDWDPTHSKMSKGITLTVDELRTVAELWFENQ